MSVDCWSFQKVHKSDNWITASAIMFLFQIDDKDSL